MTMQVGTMIAIFTVINPIIASITHTPIVDAKKKPSMKYFIF